MTEDFPLFNKFMKISRAKRRLLDKIKDIISDFEDEESSYDEMLDRLLGAIDDLEMTP